MTLQVTSRRWSGLRQGRGRLRQQQVHLVARGRGRAAQIRTIDVSLPPPSIVAKVGPLPGEVPGLPVDFEYHHSGDVHVPAARVVAVRPVGTWDTLFRDGRSAAWAATTQSDEVRYEHAG